MIDWVDMTFPLVHEHGEGTPFYAGEVMSVKPDGGLDWGVYKRMEFEGSHSSKIQIRAACTMSDGRSAIRVSGNFVKWFQGHNIFGTDNIRDLVLDMILRVVGMAKITPTEEELRLWISGDVELLRVDLTKSHDFSNRERVLNAIRSLDMTAHLKMRGRGQFNGHSLLFGKGSRRWSLTLYAKGPELDKHKMPPSLLETPLKDFADGLLRSEFRMHSMHLKTLGLDRLAAWNENTCSEVHQKHLSSLEISDATMLDASIIDAMPVRIRAVYQLWLDGHDIRTMFPRPTFYRYRAQLLPHGVDISVKQDRAPASNVVPIRVTLVGQAVTIPDWARNTPLYYEPKLSYERPQLVAA